jgi:hypothetical protein
VLIDMDVFLTIAGLIIGVSAFIYFVNAVDAGKRAAVARGSVRPVPARATASAAGSGQQMQISADTNISNVPNSVQRLPDDVKDLIPSRRCPLCSSTLTRDEPLYATNIDVAGARKILIYGCPYCHKWDKKEKV